MKTKKERLITIRGLIKSSAVSNQEELLKLLIEKGFNTTQATLSRDIKELKIIKSPDPEGNYIYTLPGGIRQFNIQTGTKSGGLTLQGFISIEFSGNLAVLKTRPGYAMGIASDIDNRATYEILGTIAGDDTILIIPRENISRKEVIETLSRFIPDIALKTYNV